VRVSITSTDRHALPAERKTVAEQLLLAVEKQIAADGELAGERTLRGNEVQAMLHPRRTGKGLAAAAQPAAPGVATRHTAAAAAAAAAPGSEPRTG
jgi:hypothetical protein